MDFKFGISTMVYYQENIKKLLPLLNRYKLGNIEIRPNAKHFECQDMEIIEDIKKEIERFDISVKAIHMPMDDVDISSLEEYDRMRSVREIEKTIMTAVKLKADLVVVHPGGKCDCIEDRKKRMAKCIDSLHEIVDFSSNWGINIALENTLPGRLGDNWSEINEVLDKIPSEYLGVCLDTGHYLINQRITEKVLLGLENQPINWEKKLIHMHIHDNNGKKDLHVLPEEGSFPWDELFSYLKQIKYQHLLVIESTEQVYIEDYLNKIKEVINRLKGMYRL